METIMSYRMGEIPRGFLKSALGRSLGVQGADAQKLGLYLLANPYLDSRGSYGLPLKAVTQHTGIRMQRVKKLLHTLRALGFCRYDFEKEWVSVPLVGDIYDRWGLGATASLCLVRDVFDSMAFTTNERGENRNA